MGLPRGKEHRVRGHLFAGRYKSLIVDDRDPHYLRVVYDYIHLNPSGWPPH
jgi:putative transposase